MKPNLQAERVARVLEGLAKQIEQLVPYAVEIPRHLRSLARMARERPAGEREARGNPWSVLGEDGLQWFGETFEKET